jgi:hypothetical protein
MFFAYFFEGLIVGSLLGLVLRPALDSYLIWRQVKEYERLDSGGSMRVEIVRTSLEAPDPGSNGHGPQRADVDDEDERIAND